MPKKSKPKPYEKEIKSGVVTQKQVDKLPPKLLDAIIKSKLKSKKKP